MRPANPFRKRLSPAPEDPLQVPLPYSDPWDLDLETRLGFLEGAEHRIGYYYPYPDFSCFRYRVFNMVEALNRSEDGLRATWFHAGDLDHLAGVIPTLDRLVVSRTRYGPDLVRLHALATEADIPVWFDLDDLLIDPSLAPLLVETMGGDPSDEGHLDQAFALTARYRRAFDLCAGGIATTPFLADRFRELTGKPVLVIPNGMNCAQLDVSERLWSHKQHLSQPASTVIGYTSGSSSHNHDLALIAPALDRLMARHAGLRLRIVGEVEIPGVLSPHADRIDPLPLQDFLNLQWCIAGMDLNLVPLRNNVFSHGKSALKYFEAAAVGTVTVASPVYPFREAIHDGVTGRLSADADWEDTLEDLIIDPAVRNRLAAAARQDALARYSPDAIRPRLSALFPPHPIPGEFPT
jgi:glycosyltransferase involved in cell wall biosynthesis